MTYTPTASEITRLRLLTGEASDGSDWTTQRLIDILTARNGDVAMAASDVWTYKAAAMASAPSKFSVDGGTYEFTEARQRCLDEAARCAAMSSCGMIIDPTLKVVQ